MRNQEIRKLAPEMDPLRMGMGWTGADLEKPQIMVESTYGDSHPGSAHLNIFVEEAVRAVNEHGGKAARYFATDLCDGMAQGHDGINERSGLSGGGTADEAGRAGDFSRRYCNNEEL